MQEVTFIIGTHTRDVYIRVYLGIHLMYILEFESTHLLYS